MPDAGRCRLLFGPYSTPTFRHGDIVTCAIRKHVEVVGLSSGLIPWPIGKLGRHRSMILYGDLVLAVRRESAQAVAHWWGVGSDTVWKWRKALGVAAVTEGTSKLKSEAALGSGVAAGRKKAHAQARDANLDNSRREKIRQAKKGKPRPRHVMEAMTKGRIKAAMKRKGQ